MPASAASEELRACAEDTVAISREIAILCSLSSTSGFPKEVKSIVLNGQDKLDDKYMTIALSEAQKAYDEDEVPVGAVIVYEDRVIARAHNQKECLKDPTAHAEMIAITQAASYLDNWCLKNCTMYVTLEPCVMCAGALVLARVARLVVAAKDPKTGACGSVYNITGEGKLNHTVRVEFGTLETESSGLLKSYFKSKREE